MKTEQRINTLLAGKKILQIFLISTIAGVLAGAFLGFMLLPQKWIVFIAYAAVVFLIEVILFWIGIILVYITSVQLGVKWRILGILCGWIPIAHIIVLIKLLKIVGAEIELETEKLELDSVRAENEECKTKYPILMVHGVFFRDTRFFNYWGRVPKELSRNGAVIYYGEQQSAASVVDSGRELAERIQKLVAETGCEKVNVIAHSKGGLDCRYAISCCGMEPYVASLTTINTPHRGCLFADYLLGKLPKSMQDFVANKYNAALRKLGDVNPDFISAVNDLTGARCSVLNQEMPNSTKVHYYSFMSKMNRAMSGQFPLNMVYHLVRHFDGENDGLVSVDSAKWGETFTFVTVKGKRGISHGDMIDLNRENIPGFDIREFYVNLVKGLKEKGL